MKESLVLAHGGVAAPLSTTDGCERAAQLARDALLAGEGGVRAAILAVETLENDGRFCAGHGSSIRLDARTVEMDAALHTSLGDFAAVAALSGVPNPIRVVEKILASPASFLAGEGARRFAERHGLTAPIEPTERARHLLARVARRAAEGRLEEEYAPWKGVDLASTWNFPHPVPDYAALAAELEPGARENGEPGGDAGGACDTVGVAIFDAGAPVQAPRFVTAVSTGGTAAMLMGRVGDSPLPGCGLYAGPSGAVTVTGEGEEIVRQMLSRWIYDRLEMGVAPRAACREGIARFAGNVQVGAIAVTDEDYGWAASHEMPVAMLRG